MSLTAIALDRTVVELKMYFRERESVFFSFLFPVLMLSLFAAVFGAAFREGGSEVSAAQFFLPGMVAGGVMLTSFQTLAMSVALERDDGTLKRLRSTPMPPVAYFLGKVGLVAVSSLGQNVFTSWASPSRFHSSLYSETQWAAMIVSTASAISSIALSRRSWPSSTALRSA